MRKGGGEEGRKLDGKTGSSNLAIVIGMKSQERRGGRERIKVGANKEDRLSNLTMVILAVCSK